MHPLKAATLVVFLGGNKFFQILSNIFLKSIAGLKKGCIFAPAKRMSDYKTRVLEAAK